jgi:DNA-binding transcriptional MerR regulator
MAKDPLTVAEVAHRSGFAPSALRFYEAKGLIEASRTSGRQRRYARAVLRRLAFIRAAGNIGLSLDEIAAELETLPQGRTPNAQDWQRISEPGWTSRSPPSRPSATGWTAASAVAVSRCGPARSTTPRTSSGRGRPEPAGCRSCSVAQ